MGANDAFQPLLHHVQDCVLVKQILDRVARQSQFREHHDCRLLVRGAPSQLERPLRVEQRIGDAQARHRGGQADEPVAVQGGEAGETVAHLGEL